MKHSSGIFGHLIELVDTTNTIVGQNERTSLQNILTGLDVLRDERGETNSRWALTAGILGTWHQSIDVLQQLRLGRT